MRKTGTIVLSGAKPLIDCIIIEISDTGAHLKVPGRAAIPTRFAFAAGEQAPREAMVVWYDVGAVGIRFDDKSPFGNSGVSGNSHLDQLSRRLPIE